MNISLLSPFFAPGICLVLRHGFGCRSRPASACSFSPPRLAINLVLTLEIPPDFRGGVHLFIYNAIRHRVSPEFIGSVITQLRTNGVHSRESTSTGPVVLKVVPVTGAAFAVIIIMEQLN